MLEVLEVSCRKNDGILGDLRVAELRFSSKGQPLTRGQFAEAIAGKRVLNFAHGYHNSEANADKTIATVAQRVDQANLGYDVLVLFSWAGGLTYAGFGMAVARTKACGLKLRELLELEALNGCRIDCASHSLGAGVVVHALASPGSAPTEKWIALAAAIPDGCLGHGQDYDVAKLSVRTIFVPFSERDSVLHVAYPLGSFGKKAMGLKGPVKDAGLGLMYPVGVTAIDVTKFVGSHSEAYQAPEVYQYWSAWALRLI